MELLPTSESDESLERLIDTLYALMIKTQIESDARSYWNALLIFIRQRSPEQIFKMEAERRLTRTDLR